MSNLVKDSPMFDYVEEISGRKVKRPVQEPVKSKEQIQLEQKQRELDLEESKLQENVQFEQEMDIGKFKNDKELKEYARATLQDDDLEVVRTSLTILNQMSEAAESL